MFSTSGDVQYIRGCSVHWGVFSTSGGGCSVHQEVFSTSGKYHGYIGDTMRTSGDVQYIKGYHDACGDIISTSGDTMSTSG